MAEAALQSLELVNSKSLRINKYQTFIKKEVFVSGANDF